MAEDDIMELFWQKGQIVRRSQPQRSTSDKSSPPPIRRGSGSGEGNALFHEQPSHQNLFIQEDEMASWLHHPHSFSHLLESVVVSTQPQSSVFQPPPPPSPSQLSALYDLPTERSSSQVFPSRRVENFMNFSRLRGNNIFTDAGVESGGGLCIPVVRESMKVGSSATPSSLATESCLIPTTVSHTFTVPGLDWKEKAVAFEDVPQIAGPSSSVVSTAETEALRVQSAVEIADDRKRKEREETNHETHETKEVIESSSRKKLRATEMHNIFERKRREKINEKMKVLQELIPRCNKSDKASLLDDAIEYVKSLQAQIHIMSMGGGGVMPMMYMANMQRFMPHMMGMGMNRPPFIPFPNSTIHRPARVSPSPYYPFPNIQAFDTSIYHQPGPIVNQPQFLSLNPYSQSVSLQQPSSIQNQTPSHLSFSQASSSKEPEDQENKPTC